MSEAFSRDIYFWILTVNVGDGKLCFQALSEGVWPRFERCPWSILGLEDTRLGKYLTADPVLSVPTTESDPPECSWLITEEPLDYIFCLNAGTSRRAPSQGKYLEYQSWERKLLLYAIEGYEGLA